MAGGAAAYAQQSGLCLYAVSGVSDRIYGTVRSKTVQYGQNVSTVRFRYGTGNRSTVQACMATRFEARARPPLKTSVPTTIIISYL